MNCQIAKNSLSAYIDRELPGDEMMSLRSHVEYCDECRNEMESLRAVKSSLSALPMVEPRAGFADDVLRQVRVESGTTVRIPVGMLVATSVAAAVLAVLVFNGFFGGRAQQHFADEGTRFDAASDSAVTSPDFGGHAPLMPVGR